MELMFTRPKAHVRGFYRKLSHRVLIMKLSEHKNPLLNFNY